MTALRTAWAAGRHELLLTSRSIDAYSWIVLTPLYTVLFVAIVELGGNGAEFTPYAVLGPPVMAVVGTAIFTAGDFIDRDRAEGILELLVTLPAGISTVLLGRTLGVLLFSSVTVVESWTVVGLLTGRWVTVAHPGPALLVFILTMLATSGLGVLLAGMFVMTRSARVLQNSLPYLLYIMGGVLVPTSTLPWILDDVSRVFYLSWATDLLRDTVAEPAINSFWPRVGVLGVLGLFVLVAGSWLAHALVSRSCREGTVGLQ